MSESKRITMEIITFIKYKDECYEIGEVIKSLLNKLDEKDQEIEILVKDDETSQQTIINQRQHIEKLDNKIYKIYQKALDTSITSIDLRDYIISSLGSGKDD